MKILFWEEQNLSMCNLKINTVEVLKWLDKIAIK